VLLYSIALLYLYYNIPKSRSISTTRIV